MKKSLLLIGLVGLAACTKEVPYKYKFTDGAMSVSSISSGDYIFAASAQQMSRNTVEGRPYSYSDNRRVTLNFTANGLQVIQKEVDSRYNSPINDHLIVEFPIQRVEYHCATDSYGECTSSEEERSDIPDEQKSSFRFDRNGSVRQGTLEILPIVLDQQLGSDCYHTLSSKIIGFQVEGNAINVQVEKRYLQDIRCMGNTDNGLADTNITAIFQYSLVKADSVLSPDFKPRTYDYSDEDTFGFFMTERDVRDVDNNPNERNKVRLMNHWNPNRTSIDYYLSAEFDKPQNAYLKDLTREAVRRLNQGLAESGAKFQITLHDNEGKNPGDIRNSMIVLVEDPTESGLLGYGPQTEDPLTGEIISARTIMFLAGFEQETHMFYDEVGRLLQEAEVAQRQAQQNQTDANIQTSEGPAASNGHVAASRLHVSSEISQSVSRVKNFLNQVNRASARTRTLGNGNITVGRPFNSAQVTRDLRRARERNGDYTRGDLQSYVKYLKEAKNCALVAGEGLTNMSHMRPELANSIKQRFQITEGAQRGQLRPWATLSAAEKQDLVHTLVGEVWIPVVLHEMGHNMGLRHNFKGSEDKDNQFSHDELAAKQINYEIPYSTIMEYGDDLHALPVLGKYDIAALRYGYAKKVEVVDSQGHVQMRSLEVANQNSGQASSVLSIAQVKTQLTAQGLNLKDYGYCTDEHVGPNPGCRRFDEGSTYSEIADYMIASYKNFYSRRNLRNDNTNFSSLDDGTALASRTSRLMDLRVFMEIYEKIKHTYGLGDDHAVFAAGGPLADLKQAALKAARFFIEIIKTPDQSCAIARVTDPSKIISIVPLSTINGAQDEMSCIGLELNESFVVVGEVGKPFNNKKDPNSNNHYADQIDVRGFYVDKMAATAALFQRNLGSSYSTLNAYLDNAWDIADIHDEVQSLIVGLMTNKLTSTQDIKLADGTVAQIENAYDYHASHLVRQPLHAFVSSQLGIRNTSVYFSEIFSGRIAGSAITNADNAAAGTALKSLVSVHLVSDLDVNAAAGQGFLAADIGGDRTAYAGASNIVARDMISDIQVQDGLGQAFADFRTQIAASGNVPAHSVRPTFRILFNYLASKLQALDQAHQSAENVLLDSSITSQQLQQEIEGLTAAEAKFVIKYVNGKDEDRPNVQFVPRYIDGLTTKMQEMREGAVSDKADIVKVLEYMPNLE